MRLKIYFANMTEATKISIFVAKPGKNVIGIKKFAIDNIFQNFHSLTGIHCWIAFEKVC